MAKTKNIESLIKQNKSEVKEAILKLNAELWTNAFNLIIDELNSDKEIKKIGEFQYVRWAGVDKAKTDIPSVYSWEYLLPGYWINKDDLIKLDIIYTTFGASYSDPTMKYKQFNHFEVITSSDYKISPDLSFNKDVYNNIKQFVLKAVKELNKENTSIKTKKK